MGALGDYIHLQWWGYAGENPKNTTTIRTEAEQIYQNTNTAQRRIMDNHRNRIKLKTIQELQDNLNIYTGFYQQEKYTTPNGKRTGLEENINKKFHKIVKTVLEKNYPHYAQAILTYKYDMKKSTSKSNTFSEQEAKKIQKVLEEKSKSTQDLLNVLLAELKKIETMYNNLSQKKQNDLKQSDFKDILLAMSNLIKSFSSKNIDSEDTVISQQIDETIQDLIASINIDKLIKEMSKKNITYKEVKDKVSKIQINLKDSGSITMSLSELIGELINLTKKAVELKRAKGDAVEYMIASAAVIGDPADLATFVLNEETEKEISNRVIGTSGVSDTLINFKFIDDKYRDKIKEQMKIKEKNGDIFITNKNVQEKIDVMVNIGNLEVGASVKNYAFREEHGMRRNITMINYSPLLSFLQEENDEKRSMADFSNHLLNLKIQHPKMPSSTETEVFDDMRLIEKYDTLLNKIILIKSIMGEGMLRYKNSSIQQMDSAELFIINNNKTGQIIVKSTAQIIDKCLKGEQSYSITYKSSDASLKLDNIKYLISDFSDSKKRIADTIMKIYNLKVKVRLNINFNNFNNL